MSAGVLQYVIHSIANAYVLLYTGAGRNVIELYNINLFISMAIDHVALFILKLQYFIRQIGNNEY